MSTASNKEKGKEGVAEREAESATSSETDRLPHFFAASNRACRSRALPSARPPISPMVLTKEKPQPLLADAVAPEGAKAHQPLLVDAVVERAVHQVTSYVRTLSANRRTKDDDKHVERAAESLMAVLHARAPTKNPNPSIRRVTISEEALRGVFHLPIAKAAAELGVGLTILKKYCRVYGISRWPFRKLKSLDKLTKTIKAIEAKDDVAVRAVAQGLLDKKNQMQLEPSIELDREIKRIRQAAYKLEHRKRQESSTNAGPSS